MEQQTLRRVAVRVDVRVHGIELFLREPGELDSDPDRLVTSFRGEWTAESIRSRLGRPAAQGSGRRCCENVAVDADEIRAVRPRVGVGDRVPRAIDVKTSVAEEIEIRRLAAADVA